MRYFRFPFGPLETNAILLCDLKEKKALVVDPALGSAKTILNKAKELGVFLEKIILTHSHWDHFADAAFLKRKTGAPLYVHALDAKNLEEPGSDHLPMLVPIEPVQADIFLKNGDVIDLGSLKLEVIHTPGHSPGGICLYLKEEKLLISGDTLFAGSIGNLSLPTADAAQMWKSLERLSLLPEETIVVPGHGRETTIGKETWLKRVLLN